MSILRQVLLVIINMKPNHHHHSAHADLSQHKQLNSSNSKYYIIHKNSLKESSSHHRHLNSSKSKDKTVNLSQERLKKRENGKEQIVTFIAKYIQK